MGSIEKVLAQVLRRGSEANISFADLCRLLVRLGFDERAKGSHHIFRRADVPERLVLQRDDGKAKPYQVRQVRKMILSHKLAGDP